jgi:uncharacterized membrane protein YfcA
MPRMEITTLQLILLALLGVLAGFMNVMAGGGSLLTLPMMLFMGLPAPLANGTNRVAILIQNIFAIGGFFSKGFSDFKLSLSLALCALPGAVAGAWLGTSFGGAWFNRLLAGIMVVVMVLMLQKKKKTKDAPESEAPTQTGSKPQRLVLGHLCMVGIGFYGGFIQAGVGFLLMAVLHRVMAIDLVRVNMHKVFIVGVFTLAALIVFASRGQVFWKVGLVLAIGNAIGGWLGSHVSVGGGEKWIRIVFFVALIGMALKLLVRSVA